MMKPKLSKGKKKPKKRKLSNAKKAAWDALSICIRYSHAEDGIHAACVTCGKVLPITELDAGHYEPKNRSNALYFCHQNAAPQCTGCNRFKSGNITEYARWMLREYGQGHLDRLAEMRTMEMRWRVPDYEEMEAHYKAELDRMKKLRSEGVTGRIEVIGYV